MQATYHRFQWVVCYTSDNVGMPSEFVKWGGAANVINVGLYTHVHVWETIEEDGRPSRRMGDHRGGWETIEEDGRASRRMGEHQGGWESIEEDRWESVVDRGSACMGWGPGCRGGVRIQSQVLMVVVGLLICLQSQWQ